MITFDAAQRGNYQASHQDFQVLVDGVVVGTFTPTGTAYQGYTTAAFTVTAGSHTIKFQGLDSAGGDNTAFVDDVALDQPSHRSATRVSSRWWWVPASSSTDRPAHPGPSLAAPASRATTAALPQAIRRPPRAHKSPSFRKPARSASRVAAGPPAVLHAELPGRPAGQLPGVPAGLQRAGRRRGGGHLHALRDVVPDATPPPRSPSRPGRTRSSSRAWTAPAVTTPPSSTCSLRLRVTRLGLIDERHQALSENWSWQAVNGRSL